eukprot:gene8566-33998_t
MFSWCKRADSDVERSPVSSEGNPATLSDGDNGRTKPRKGLKWNTPSMPEGPGFSGNGKPPTAPKSSRQSKNTPPVKNHNGNKIVPLLTDDMLSENIVPVPASSGQPIRNYSGEELEVLGFPVYSAGNLAARLPTSNKQPLALLALETDADMRIATNQASAGSFSNKQQNKLVPIHVNPCCENYFDINSFKEYAPVIRKLLKRDPLLTFALQKALRFLKVAELKSVNHVTPDPSGETSSLFGMRIGPCVWSEDGILQPALLVEHNVPYNPAEIMPRLMRDYAVLSHVPAILTLIDFQGKVLYQNASSLAYMGDLLSANFTTRGLVGMHKKGQKRAPRASTTTAKDSAERLWPPLNEEGEDGPVPASAAAIAAAARLEDNDELYDDAYACFHEVHAIPLLDPVLDKQVVMLVKTDATPRVELENRLVDLIDAHTYMLARVPGPGNRSMKDLANTHDKYMLARVPGPSTRSMKDLANTHDKYLLARVSGPGTRSMKDLTNTYDKNMLARVLGPGNRSMKDLANTHDKVMVLFADVVGFTSMSKEVEPSQVLHFLNELYLVFDDLLGEYGMYKLDIVGDCYIVVAGLIKEDQDGFVCVDEIDEDQITSNAVRIMQFAKAMLRESKPVLMPHNSEPVKLRIGIHTGKLVSGLIGSKMPKFTLFGDTMNTASRMESTCRVGCVHVSDTFGDLLPHEDWEPTGGVEVKGKGLMQTRLWVPNSERQELIDLSPEHALPQLRKMLTMASFSSTKSKALTDFMLTIASFSSTKSKALTDFMLTMASFSSTKSKALADFGKSQSGRSRYGDDDDEDDEDPTGSRTSNPLMAILENIRGDDDGCMSIAGGAHGGIMGGGGGSGGRPKSAYARKGRAAVAQRHSNHLDDRFSNSRSRGGGSTTELGSIRSIAGTGGHSIEHQGPFARTSHSRMSSQDRRSAMRFKSNSNGLKSHSVSVISPHASQGHHALYEPEISGVSPGTGAGSGKFNQIKE